MRPTSFMVAALLTGLIAAPVRAATDVFWDNVRALCGKAYAGHMTHSGGQAVAPDRWPQVLHVHRCEDNQVYMRFVQDRMPNLWYRRLVRHADGQLELRHDYRDPDGTPSELGDYGGFTPNPGSATAQIFPADAHTTGMASANWPRPWARVWMLEVRPGQVFAYSGVTIGSPATVRFEFDLSQTVDSPPAWGWEE
jgi:hypothetical protein